ncbi:MAG: hypothetical protein LBE91_22080 [Tannerella sp.]|jgi:hypothetical protein|nr:hypothetical protein [Tannerella sp.]
MKELDVKNLNVKELTEDEMRRTEGGIFGIILCFVLGVLIGLSEAAEVL